MAQFVNEHGVGDVATFGPMVQTVKSTLLFARYDDILPNTNYTVEVSAETRTQKGFVSEAYCQMPATLPDKHVFGNMTFARYRQADSWILALHLARLSERRGSTHCE